MLLLLLAPVSAHACSCTESVWVEAIAPIGDAVPVNTRIYAFLVFDSDEIYPGDGDITIGVHSDGAESVEVASVHLHKSTNGAVAIADLVEPLEPETDYSVSVVAWSDWDIHLDGPGHFRTANAEDLEAPAAPVDVSATVARRSGSCSSSREVSLDVTAEPGAILIVHSGPKVWMVPPGDHTWTDSFCNPSPVPSDDFVVVAEDSAGNTSEASASAQVRPAGCGCAASPTSAAWWVLAVLAFSQVFLTRKRHCPWSLRTPKEQRQQV